VAQGVDLEFKSQYHKKKKKRKKESKRKSKEIMKWKRKMSGHLIGFAILNTV
jgi:hypothetical protein